MPAHLFKKKAFFFVIVFASVVLVLVLLHFAEALFRSYILARFGLGIGPQGEVVMLEGGPPGMVALTSVGLLLNLVTLAKIALWMALIVATVRFAGHLLFATALRRSSQSEVASLLRTILSMVVYAVSFFIIIQSQYPGVELTPLFTGSTIVGIVVGLALQDTLGNLFAGVAMQADQPFQVGDVISIPGRGSGVVEAVSWRGVKIRTFQNRLLIMSNSVMGKESIEVAPRSNLNARLVFFNSPYSQSPARTIQLVRDAVRQVENVSAKIRPIVRMRDFGESSLDWEVKYWAEDYTRYNDTDALIRQRIWYVFNREKIEFPFPTRTLHLERSARPRTADLATETAGFLARVPIFAPLSDEEMEKLAAASSSRIYAPGEAVVRKGQEGNSMFVIMRGSVNVQVSTPEGGVKTINTLGPDDYFGEMCLLTGEPRTATVAAVEETEVMRIAKEALKPIFEDNPELVSSVSELVEERRQALRSVEQESRELPTADSGQGILSSIRKFFGMERK
jgi:small-conductance mechanosensitive channel/CRP-like cAMP-binding protein